MDETKPICSYGTSCFRKNPFHFKQLSHPHLKKLLSQINEGDIVLPDNLEFQCGNRTLLREQLEILRTVEENKNNEATSQPILKKRCGTPCEETSSKKNSRLTETPAVSKSNNGTSPATSNDSSYSRSLRMREAVLNKMKQLGTEPRYVAPMGDFALKWILAAPYYIFFTAVPKTRETWKQSLSVTLSEILDKSMGDIEQSLHTNMVVDFGWLVAQYMIAGQDHKPKMTVFYHDSGDTTNFPENIKAHRVKCPSSFGTHHCKISIFQYKDSGIRIVVSTANLYLDDWEYRTQGLWISPHLPRLDNSAKVTDGESATGFKKDFCNFLANYDSRMDNWKNIVSRADCSSINVAFVGSVPGDFNLDDNRWGHQKLGSLLKNHSKVPDNENSTTIIAQVSSIGSLGPNYRSWIGNEIVASMSKNQEPNTKTPEFKLIFPTIDDYKNSHDMKELANCLCNSRQNKQEWITQYMHKWKADKISRTRAIPHIKTFTRISEDNKRIWWFAMGSANLSKAAWGQRFKGKYRILSYEAGVVFFPKFVTGENDFSTCDDSTKKNPTFPMPYDLPLTSYSSNDRAFVDDFFRDDFSH